MKVIRSISEFKTFDTVVVSTSGRLLPEIIQGCQRIDNAAAGIWNHAFKTYRENGILKVIEAEKKGIEKNNFDNYLKDNCFSAMLVLRPKFAFSQSDIDYMLSFINNAKYDKLGLLAEAIRYLTIPIAKLFGSKKGLWIGGKKENGKNFMCGNFCGTTDEHANKGMFDDLPLPEITPSDLVMNKYYEHIFVSLNELRKEFLHKY